MKATVIVFPGSNCDRDVAVSLEQATGHKPEMLWHGESQVPATDLIVLPGGFSYGDYLRCGAMAAHSPVMRDVVAKAKTGTRVLGICNGFQILTESGLLPGVLMQNMSLKYICRDIHMRVERTDTDFTSKYAMAASCASRSPITKAITTRTKRPWTDSRAKAVSPSAIAPPTATSSRRQIPTARHEILQDSTTKRPPYSASCRIPND